jgi:hypothetical protein
VPVLHPCHLFSILGKVLSFPITRLPDARITRSPDLFLIRLRGAPIERSPKVVFTISESVQLAGIVLDAVERRG